MVAPWRRRERRRVRSSRSGRFRLGAAPSSRAPRRHLFGAAARHLPDRFHLHVAGELALDLCARRPCRDDSAGRQPVRPLRGRHHRTGADPCHRPADAAGPFLAGRLSRGSGDGSWRGPGECLARRLCPHPRVHRDARHRFGADRSAAMVHTRTAGRRTASGRLHRDRRARAGYTRSDGACLRSVARDGSMAGFRVHALGTLYLRDRRQSEGGRTQRYPGAAVRVRRVSGVGLHRGVDRHRPPGAASGGPEYGRSGVPASRIRRGVAWRHHHKARPCQRLGHDRRRRGSRRHRGRSEPVRRPVLCRAAFQRVDADFWRSACR